MAVVGPVKPQGFKSPANSWAGRAEITGDIVHSDTANQWESFREE